mmetsp:Transcript_1726/g.4760  ORF Transcript_1726/g.4760 Transcript_1726/m.4760 type:complete len:251 (-) Transcript_1726:141-893(-)
MMLSYALKVYTRFGSKVYLAPCLGTLRYFRRLAIVWCLDLVMASLTSSSSSKASIGGSSPSSSTRMVCAPPQKFVKTLGVSDARSISMPGTSLPKNAMTGRSIQSGGRFLNRLLYSSPMKTSLNLMSARLNFPCSTVCAIRFLPSKYLLHCSWLSDLASRMRIRTLPTKTSLSMAMGVPIGAGSSVRKFSSVTLNPLSMSAIMQTVSLRHFDAGGILSFMKSVSTMVKCCRGACCCVQELFVLRFAMRLR